MSIVNPQTHRSTGAPDHECFVVTANQSLPTSLSRPETGGHGAKKGFERTRCASLILLVSGDVGSNLDEQSVVLIPQMEGDAECNRRGDDRAHAEYSEE